MSQEIVAGLSQLALAVALGAIALAARLVEGPQFYVQYPVMWLAVAGAVVMAVAGTTALVYGWRDIRGPRLDPEQEWDWGTAATYERAVGRPLTPRERGHFRAGAV